MTQSPTIGAIAAALAKAQGQIKGAAKDSVNPHFKSRYADLASIVDACKAPLAAAGIAAVQGVEADGPVVKVTTTLIHSSGEWLASTLSMTSAQNTPQGIGSTITYGRRYGLASMVGVAPDDDDGEAASRPAREDPPPPKARPASPAIALWTHLVADCGGDDAAAKARMNQAATAHFGVTVPPSKSWTDEDCAKVNAILFPDIKF